MYRLEVEPSQGLSFDRGVELVQGYTPVVVWEADGDKKTTAWRGAMYSTQRQARDAGGGVLVKYRLHLRVHKVRLDLVQKQKREDRKAAFQRRRAYVTRVEKEKHEMVKLLRDLSNVLKDSGFDRRVNEILERIGPEVPVPPKSRD